MKRRPRSELRPRAADLLGLRGASAAPVDPDHHRALRPKGDRVRTLGFGFGVQGLGGSCYDEGRRVYACGRPWDTSGSRTASLLVVAMMGRRRGVEIFPTSQSQLWLVTDDSNFPGKKQTNRAMELCGLGGSGKFEATGFRRLRSGIGESSKRPEARNAQSPKAPTHLSPEAPKGNKNAPEPKEGELKASAGQGYIC